MHKISITCKLLILNILVIYKIRQDHIFYKLCYFILVPHQEVVPGHQHAGFVNTEPELLVGVEPIQRKDINIFFVIDI